MGSNILVKGINDLKTVNPALASEWDNDRNGNTGPDEVMSGSEKKAWWKCSLGHSWRAAVYSRNSAGNGCPYCAGQKVLAGFNDLASRNPALASEWDYEKNGPLKPEEVTERSNRKKIRIRSSPERMTWHPVRRNWLWSGITGLTGISGLKMCGLLPTGESGGSAKTATAGSRRLI